jgi:hypothetical protein
MAAKLAMSSRANAAEWDIDYIQTLELVVCDRATFCGAFHSLDTETATRIRGTLHATWFSEQRGPSSRRAADDRPRKKPNFGPSASRS